MTTKKPKRCGARDLIMWLPAALIVIGFIVEWILF